MLMIALAAWLPLAFIAGCLVGRAVSRADREL